MSDCKAKMHQIRGFARPCWVGKLTALPRHPSWILGAYF